MASSSEDVDQHIFHIWVRHHTLDEEIKNFLHNSSKNTPHILNLGFRSIKDERKLFILIGLSFNLDNFIKTGRYP
jgi:hypothetical protein